ncbi:MAG: hypothetical protein ACE5Z5_04080 [Candidatus Bathyarchaeia archaeon]
MLTIDEIISHILSKRPDLTQERVRELIRQKRGEADGLLTEEGAAYMVANELGVRLTGEKRPETTIRIRDLTPGINDATLTGRVLLVYPIQTFARSNGSQGRVARLVVADGTGVLNVVLWDERADVVAEEKISQGQIVRILHGYVRAGLDGGPELNVGFRGDVVVAPSDVSDGDYPRVERFFKKIGELEEGDRNVNLMGVVARVSPISTFRRPDGRPGKVMRVRLVDETGRIGAVFWNERVDEVEGVKRGDFLRTMGARAKKGLRGGVELHVERRSQVKILTERPPDVRLPPAKLSKIGEIGPEMADIDVIARVIHVGPVREFERPRGGVGRVADLTLRDETGFVRLALWDEHAEVASRASPNDIVLVEGAYAREGLRGVDLNLGRWGKISLNPPIAEADRPPPATGEPTPISQLKADLRLVTVEGTVLEPPTVRDVTTMNGQLIRVASFMVGDQTGMVRVSMWRDLVEEVKDLSTGARIRVVNVYVRTGLGGGLELSSGYLTTIEREP